MQFENRAPIVHRNDPETSAIAAEELGKSGRRDAQKTEVLRLVLKHPGLTSDELALHLEQVWDEARFVAARRLPDLKSDGHVEQGTIRVSEVGGRRCVTWWPTESGTRLIQELEG